MPSAERNSANTAHLPNNHNSPIANVALDAELTLSCAVDKTLLSFLEVVSLLLQPEYQNIASQLAVRLTNEATSETPWNRQANTALLADPTLAPDLVTTNHLRGCINLTKTTDHFVFYTYDSHRHFLSSACK
jgi:hypothetical protein